MRRRWLLLILALQLAPAAGARSDSDLPIPASEWASSPQPGRRLSGRADLRGVGALALAADGRLALGDAHGARLLAADGSELAVQAGGPVRDLLFDASGALLVASDRGLHRLERSADSTRSLRVRELALGAGNRAVKRLAAAAELRFAGTAEGLFASRAGGPWLRLAGRLPQGEVTGLVARDLGSQVTELYAVMAGAAYRVVLGPGALPGALREARPLAVAGLAAYRDARDIAFGPPGTDVVVLAAARLLARDPSGAWTVHRPLLAPGAEPLRVIRAVGRLWIATDRGLFVAEAPAGPWRRAGPPAGNTPILALAGAARLLLAAGSSGVFAYGPEAGSFLSRPSLQVKSEHGLPLPDPAGARPTGASHGRAETAQDPSMAAVRAAALDYLDLGPGPLRALRLGVERRGWLPELDLRGAYGEASHRQDDYDQAFSSGALRRLYDRSEDRDRDWSLSLGLAWDLADTRYHPEAIDVSREAREVIELRDDVLDEISQLYFERQRVLRALATEPDAGERGRLALRAAELGAGLDAWTGGWFGRRAAPASRLLSPRAPGLETRP